MPLNTNMIQHSKPIAKKADAPEAMNNYILEPRTYNDTHFTINTSPVGNMTISGGVNCPVNAGTQGEMTDAQEANQSFANWPMHNTSGTTGSNISPPATPYSNSPFSPAGAAVNPTTPGTPITPFSLGNHTPLITPVAPKSTTVLVQGMPFSFDRLKEMGEALTKARRERRFPPTITPTYNVQALIDDYEALERLEIAREGEGDTRDDAFRPNISRMYIEIQRKIQDRDLTYGEVAADSNVRARINGLANGTSAEAGIYNLMRHAVNSVLRHNRLTLDSDSNTVDAISARVVNAIRSNVQSQVDRGAHGVDGVNMSAVLEQVFNNIEHALGDHVNKQADRFDGITDAQRMQLDSMNNVTNAQNMQVNAIAGHVNAIDNHVHAMGNNVNAMNSLVNSTNGNVTALSSNVGSLQLIVNMLPQMVAKSVGDILPQAIHGAVEEALETAITRELFNRMQMFVNSVEAVREREHANQQRRRQRSSNENSWFGKLNIFKKRPGHRGSTCSRGN